MDDPTIPRAGLVAHIRFGNMLAALLWLSFLYASYNGAMVVALTEIMPPQVRTTGFSVAYSLATALFGGFTPLIATWLIEETGNRAAPGLWVAFAGLCGLVATIAIYWLGIRARDTSAPDIALAK